MSRDAWILVLDDEADMQLGLSETLRDEGYLVDAAGDGREGLEMAAFSRYDLALVDLRMPGLDGMGVLEGIQKASPDTVVVVMTGYATVESAVDAMKRGAFDYLSKPFKLDHVRLVVGRALEKKR